MRDTTMQVGAERNTLPALGRGDSTRYSFRDFVLLRAVLAREVAPLADGGGPGFASGWRLCALMFLRR